MHSDVGGHNFCCVPLMKAGYLLIVLSISFVLSLYTLSANEHETSSLATHIGDVSRYMDSRNTDLRASSALLESLTYLPVLQTICCLCKVTRSNKKPGQGGR